MRKTLIYLTPFLLVPFLACSHGTTKNLVVSNDMPSADGTLLVTETDNNNAQVTLEVKHLPQPARLKNGSTTYVVWAQPTFGEARPQNMGALVVDKDLTGRYAGVLPSKRYMLFVTPEVSREVSQPNGERVLSSSVMQAAE